MYRIRSVLYSVLRHRRRNIVSCFLLAVILSVVFCAFLYGNFASAEAARIADTYDRRYALTFRDELQYHPDFPRWSAFEIWKNGTSTTDGIPDIFFDEEVMAPYNHSYPASREIFEALGEKSYCTGWELAYADTAYGFAETIPAWMQENLDSFYSMHGDLKSPGKILTEHMVVGGSLDAFTGLSREHSSCLYDFILKEGREPGPGECVITDFYADIYGKSVGDTLLLCDLYGNPVRELTISGIYAVYEVKFYEKADPAVEKSGRKLTGSSLLYDYSGRPDFGTPYDRLCENNEAYRYIQERYKGEYYHIFGAMLSLIHTDFETAYHLYGAPETDSGFADRHHINHFFAWYDLADPSYEEAFAADVKALLPEAYAEQFSVLSFQRSKSEYLQTAERTAADAELLKNFFIPLAVLGFGLISFVLVRENGRETGILLGLGISEGDIILRSAGENTVVLMLSLFMACGGGGLVFRLLLRDSPHMQLAGLTYRMVPSAWWFALCMVAVGMILTAVMTVLYIRVHSPIRLIRQE